MEKNPDRIAAERRVRAKLSFLGHAATYVLLVMTMLAVINLTTTPGDGRIGTG